MEEEFISTNGLIPGEESLLLPPRIDFVHRTLQKNVSSDAAIWLYLEQMVQESLPLCEVVGIQQFGIPALWAEYKSGLAKIKRRIAMDASAGTFPDALNRKLVFHGSPAIDQILGFSATLGLNPHTGGLDNRKSCEGAYSRDHCGSYFATHAAYPVLIHPAERNIDGSFSVLVCEIACGVVYDYASAVPAEKPERPPLATGGRVCDTVRGTENNIGINCIFDKDRGVRNGDEKYGEQFVAFSANQAYPHYLLALKLPSVTYGSKVRLVHCLTKHALHSHDFKYTVGSQQQQVTCYEPYDSNDIFIVKAEHGTSSDYLRGQEVCHQDVIRLEHVNTKRNLHSHSIKSQWALCNEGETYRAHDSQQEVSCFGEDGEGDSNDNWRLEIEGASAQMRVPWIWHPSHRSKVRLIHELSNHALHSHAWKYEGNQQQEVTCFESRDANDYWAVVFLESV